MLSVSPAQPREGLASKTAILLINRLPAHFATGRQRAEYSTLPPRLMFAGNLPTSQNSSRALSTTEKSQAHPPVLPVMF